jgi:hypothetical protein
MTVTIQRQTDSEIIGRVDDRKFAVRVRVAHRGYEIQNACSRMGFTPEQLDAIVGHLRDHAPQFLPNRFK